LFIVEYQSYKNVQTFNVNVYAKSIQSVLLLKQNILVIHIKNDLSTLGSMLVCYYLWEIMEIGTQTQYSPNRLLFLVYKNWNLTMLNQRSEIQMDNLRKSMGTKSSIQIKVSFFCVPNIQGRIGISENLKLHFEFLIPKQNTSLYKIKLSMSNEWIIINKL